MNGRSGLSYPTADYPITHWAQKRTMKEAMDACARFMAEAFEKPYIVGYGKCQFPSVVGVYGELVSLKQGIVDLNLDPIPEFIAELKRINSKILHEALGTLRA